MNTGKRKTVCFSSPAEFRPSLKTRRSSLQFSPSRQSTTTIRQDDAVVDIVVRDFVAPTVCSLCGNSIAAVSLSLHVLHSRLLLTMLRLFSNASLIKAVFSTLESNHSFLMRDYRGDRRLQQKPLIICRILSKAARVENGGVAKHPEFSANVIDSMLCITKSDFSDIKSISFFLSEYVKVGCCFLFCFFLVYFRFDRSSISAHLPTIPVCPGELVLLKLNLPLSY